MKYFVTYLLILFGLLFWTLTSFGEIYKWIGETGTVFFTDDLTKVPENYILNIKKTQQNYSKATLLMSETSQYDFIYRKQKGMIESPQILNIYEEKSWSELFNWIAARATKRPRENNLAISNELGEKGYRRDYRS